MVVLRKALTDILAVMITKNLCHWSLFFVFDLVSMETIFFLKNGLT